MSTQGWVLVRDSKTRDKTSKEVYELEYLVWGYSAGAIITNPTTIFNAAGQSLPGYGVGIPGGVQLDRYDVEENQDGTVRVVGVWSTQGIQVLRQRPKQERIGYQALGLDTWQGTTTIPIAVRQTYAASGGDLAEDVLFESWTTATQELQMGFSRRRFQTTMQVVSPSDFEAIEDQTGKLHLFSFGGTARYYLYEGAQVSQQDEGMYTISHSWQRQNGVDVFLTTTERLLPVEDRLVHPLPTITSLMIQETQPQWQEAGAWLVPPFHQLGLRINTRALTLMSQPFYAHVLTHDIDNQGWQNLPGL